MFKLIKKIFVQTLQDENGNFSHARVIAMLVAIAATVFIWKLIIVGGMTVDYFIAYLAYGSGHQALNKYLDTRAPGASAANPQSPPKPPPPVPTVIVTQGSGKNATPTVTTIPAVASVNPVASVVPAGPMPKTGV